MNIEKEIKLSSNWTNVSLYLASFLLILMTPILFFVVKEQEFNIGMIFSGIIFLTLIGFLIYLFIYSCDTRIVGDKIIMKKQFRQSKSYSFDKIGHPTSFQLKRTRYITVQMKNNDNTSEKYLIMNTKSLLSFENKDVEQTLINLRNLVIKK